MKIVIIILSCLLVFFCKLFAQKGGFIVLNTGDTLSGQVFYHLKRNEPKIVFWPSNPPRSRQHLFFKDLKSFRTSEGDDFEKLSRWYPYFNYCESGRADDGYHIVSFVHPLLIGETCSLYEDTDRRNDLIIKMGPTVVQLALVQPGTEGILEEPVYNYHRKQLRRLLDEQLRNDPILNAMINGCSYKLRDLETIANWLNGQQKAPGQSQGTVTVPTVGKPWKPWTYFLGINTGLGQLKRSPVNIFPAQVLRGNIVGITAGIDRFYLHGLFIRASLAFNRATYSQNDTLLGADNRISYRLLHYSIQPSMSVLVPVYSHHNGSAMLGVGLVYNFSIIKPYRSISGHRETTKYDVDEGSLALDLKAGIRLGKRWEMLYTFQAGSFSEQIFSARGTYKAHLLGFNYRVY